MSEAQHLEDNMDSLGIGLEYEEAEHEGGVQRMKAAYRQAKEAPTGSVIVCPVCGRNHTKTTYHKVFCSNGKNGGRNCKDRYWNVTVDSRRERAIERMGGDW